MKEIKLTNSQLTTVLIHLMSFDEDQKPSGGLLLESTSLGLKRRLQKIRNACIEKYKEYAKDLDEIKAGNLPKEEQEKEIETLNNESVLLTGVERAQLSLIENIVSENSYDFTIIELFAE